MKEELALKFVKIQRQWIRKFEEIAIIEKQLIQTGENWWKIE
jgi:hypothetical protein